MKCWVRHKSTEEREQRATAEAADRSHKRKHKHKHSRLSGIRIASGHKTTQAVSAILVFVLVPVFLIFRVFLVQCSRSS